MGAQVEVGSRIGVAANRLASTLPREPSAARPGSPGIIIPTFNARRYWRDLSASLSAAEVDPAQVLIIDSSSYDGTCDLACASGYRVLCIPQKEFNHGGTRQMACSYFPGVERLVFCSQDVVFRGPRSIESLSEALDDPAVGAAYGRQIPRDEANPIERHARLFNYPQQGQVRTFASRAELGFKTAFFSNSFSIYRRAALEDVGGFPGDVLIAEDSIVAARMLMRGWKVVYKADAEVTHSHPLSLLREASRYFDIGAHHARESWLRETFGTTSSEGKLFFRSEMKYLLAEAPHLIPLAFLRTANKLAAYHLGGMERFLPTALKQKLSDYPQFWHDNPRKAPQPGSTA